MKSKLSTIHRLRIFALFVVLTSCVICSVGYAVSRIASVAPDDISLYELRFGRLKAELPENEVIGYVNDEKDSLQATKKFYVAQYVLSPHVLVNSTKNTLVIADFYTSSPRTSWENNDFVLVKDLGEGVALYRRTK